MLSFIKTGIPCKGPLLLPAFISLSIATAIATASGLTSITEFNCGPFLSIVSIRFKYNCTNCSEVYFPEANFSLKLPMVSSSSSKVVLECSADATSSSFLVVEVHPVIKSVVKPAEASVAVVKKDLLFIG